MIRVTAPTIAAQWGYSIPLDVKGATITLDESVAPFVDVQLVCARPDTATLDRLDPRGNANVQLQVNDHADLFGQPATSRSWDLLCVSRDAATVPGEMTLHLVSDEQRYINALLLAGKPKVWGAVTAVGLARAVVNYLVEDINASGVTDYVLQAGADVQTPGTSFWDFIDGALQGGNLRLWDPAEVGPNSSLLQLTDKALIQPGRTSLDAAGTVTAITDTIARDENYVDHLVVQFNYVKADGTPAIAYDTASDGVNRGALIEFQGPPGVSGTARRLLRRMQGRGRALTVEAVNRFDVMPGQPFTMSYRDGTPDEAGLVSAVSWAFPSDRMTIRTRELSDIQATMWAAQNGSWQDVSAGVSWNGYLAEPWSGQAAGTSWSSIPAGVRWTEY